METKATQYRSWLRQQFSGQEILLVILMSFVLGCGELPKEGAPEDGADQTMVIEGEGGAFSNEPNDVVGENGLSGAHANTYGVHESALLSQDPHTAIQLEAYYALQQRYDGTSDVPPIGGMAVGGWNYLANDLNAYQEGLRRFACWSSLWTRDGRCVLGGYGGPFKIMGDNNFYDRPDRYGFYGGRGRGGQCLYFAWLLFYRSGVRFQLPGLAARSIPVSYSAVLNDYRGSRLFTKPSSQARIGDPLYNPWEWHTTVVVGILAGEPGRSVTAVDLIDSNYISWGPANEEIIARHPIDTRGSGAGDLDRYIAVDVYRYLQ